MISSIFSKILLLKGEKEKYFCLFTKMLTYCMRVLIMKIINHFATSFASVVDTEFAAGIVNTGGKFATSANDPGGKLPPLQRHWQQICHWC